MCNSAEIPICARFALTSWVLRAVPNGGSKDGCWDNEKRSFPGFPCWNIGDQVFLKTVTPGLWWLTTSIVHNNLANHPGLKTCRCAKMFIGIFRTRWRIYRICLECLKCFTKHTPTNTNPPGSKTRDSLSML